jgi:transposase
MPCGRWGSRGRNAPPVASRSSTSARPASGLSALPSRGELKGAEGLAALVREEMQSDPFSGAVYVFRAKRADRVKLIFWDGTGVCLFAKRLEDGAFRWPNVQDGVMHLTAAQLSALLEGLDWRRVHTMRETAAPAQPS